MKLSVILSAVVALFAVRSACQVEAAPGYVYQGPPAPLAQDGTVLDTPEVAQAKAAHLAAHAAALARASHGHHYDQGQYAGYHNEDTGAYNGAAQYNSQPHIRTQTYQGPAAPLAHDGRVVDTPEVAHARAAHLAAHAHALARTNQLPYRAYEDDGQYRGQGYAVPAVPAAPVQVSYAHSSPVTHYQGPFAPLGQDGRVIDTPEVAQARAAHLQAYAYAAALTTHPGHAPAKVQAHAPAEPQYHAPAEPQYHAPPEPQYHAPAEPQYHAPAEPQYHAPAEPQHHAPAEAQFHASAEAQVHEPSAEGENSYEEGYY